MKKTVILFLITINLNICFGQNSFHFKKHPLDIHHRHDFTMSNLPQFQGYRDLKEQVDSAWTRQYSGFQAGNVTSQKSYFTYTNDHLLASESYLDFYLESGKQYNGRQEEYFYNDQGLCTLHYTNEQDLASGDWLRKDREELVWNQGSLPDEWIRSAWNEDLSDFDYISKSIWTYTSFNQADEYFYFSWDVDHWKPAGKYNYEYNNVDSIQVINIYKWIEGSDEWQLEFKTEFFIQMTFAWTVSSNPGIWDLALSHIAGTS